MGVYTAERHTLTKLRRENKFDQWLLYLKFYFIHSLQNVYLSFVLNSALDGQLRHLHLKDIKTSQSFKEEVSMVK